MRPRWPRPRQREEPRAMSVPPFAAVGRRLPLPSRSPYRGVVENPHPVRRAPQNPPTAGARRAPCTSLDSVQPALARFARGRGHARLRPCRCGVRGAPVPAMGVSGAAAAPPSVWNIVALGDSDATGEGDSTGLGWVERYARLLRQKLGLKVEVDNLAENGKTSSELLSQVRSDPTTRAALKKAQIVLIGIGGADLGAGDDGSTPGRARATRATRPICSVRAQPRCDGGARPQAAGSKQAVLRAITLPNVVPGGAEFMPPFITGEIGGTRPPR